MNENRHQIYLWQKHKRIKNHDIKKALNIAKAEPSPHQWLIFIRQSILWLGLSSLAMGIIFFFAYNWENISDISKFVIIQVCILVGLFVYTQTKKYSTVSTAMLFFLSLLLGSLFALFGQTFQTGKDPWQLFAIWSISIIPLALTSKHSSLWILWLFLSFMALYLAFEVRYGILGFLINHQKEALIYAFIGALSGFMFEVFYRIKFIDSRVVVHVAMVCAMIAFTFVTVMSIVEIKQYYFDQIYYISWMAAVYYFYRIKTVDALILSSWVVSAIIFIITAFGRIIDTDLDGVTYLLFVFIIVGLSTAGGNWLLKLIKQSKEKGDIS